MEWLLRWLVSDLRPSYALVAFVIVVVTMTLVPRELRRRLRLAAGLFVFVALVVWLERAVPPTSGFHRDLVVVAAICFAIAVARYLFVVVVDLAAERAGARPINQLQKETLQALAVVFATGVALHATGIPPSSLIATGTVLTAIIGLAMQETLGNLAAGLAIQIEKPVGVGDWIQLDKGDALGRVVSTNWRSVIIQVDDRAQFVIPNGVFSKSAFYNRSRPGGAFRRNLYFQFPYDVPPQQVQEALLAACADVSEVLTDPKATVLTWTYGDNGITYWLRFFIGDFTRRDILSGEVATRIWYQLHRRKMPLAVPVRQSFLHTVDRAAIEQASRETISDRRAAIDHVDWLKSLPANEKSMLAERGHRKLFAKGETVLRQGDAGREFFIVRRGHVGVNVGDAEVAEFGPGEFFGELALLTGEPRNASVVALEETEVFEIDDRMFSEVLQREPKIAEEISNIVGARQAHSRASQTGSGPPSMVEQRSVSQEILQKIKQVFALD
ncbi:MAG: cyclic nucleotide-binding domain-containing protein [Polyangiales bacterium]